MAGGCDRARGVEEHRLALGAGRSAEDLVDDSGVLLRRAAGEVG